MTAFDHFQIATCCISDGDNKAATVHLTAAIAKMDDDGVDAELRHDVVALRELLSK